MSKFYEVSKVLDKRTDAHGRVKYLVRWRCYGKNYDSWVDETDANERLKQLLVAVNIYGSSSLQAAFLAATFALAAPVYSRALNKLERMFITSITFQFLIR